KEADRLVEAHGLDRAARQPGQLPDPQRLHRVSSAAILNPPLGGRVKGRRVLTSSTAGLAAITLFIGFCIFDGDHHGTSHHGMSPLASAWGSSCSPSPWRFWDSPRSTVCRPSGARANGDDASNSDPALGWPRRIVHSPH